MGFFLENLRHGRGLAASDEAAMIGIVTANGRMEKPSNDSIAASMAAVFKILAFRFTPEESQTVMTAELQRLVERMRLATKRTTFGPCQSIARPTVHIAQQGALRNSQIAVHSDR